MINTFYNISNKIEARTVELIRCIDVTLKANGTEFVLVGAGARDVIFRWIFDIQPIRGTLDQDFAVHVATWDEYRKIIKQLVQNEGFQLDAKKAQRLHHSEFGIVDLIPYGPIENPKGTVTWPPDFGTILNTCGFQEAYDAAATVRVSVNPFLDTRVCTPAGLAILKLFAWSDRKMTKGKDDASDLSFIMHHYIDIISGADQDLFTEDFDYELTSARMLGRHIANIAQPDTIASLQHILSPEITSDGYRLVSDLTQEAADIDKAFDHSRRMLRALEQGLRDRINHELDSHHDNAPSIRP